MTLVDQVSDVALSVELRRPYAESLNETPYPDDDKKSKAEASYDDGPVDHSSCSDCRNYCHGSCNVVRGAIGAGGTCDYWFNGYHGKPDLPQRDPQPAPNANTFPARERIGPHTHLRTDD